MQKEEKQYKIVSPLGVPYELGETKAKAMVSKLGCKWVGDEPKGDELTANEVAELISKVATLEDLKKYNSDTRQIVKAAFGKKYKELSK